MSLSKQLIIIISFLFVLVFAGTMLISIHTTRIYLEEQMESHAQDTATSLGLSITHAVKNKDIPFMNSMIDAIFDHGYYRDLVLKDVQGKVLVSRTLSVTLDNVPGWFVDLIPLNTPEGKAVIMTGWTQLGEIVAHSHPGYAYDKLWRTTVSIFWWFISASVVISILITILLKLTLSPLRSIEKIAKSISEREFPVVKKIPWTRELRQVVIAINKMSTSLKKIISDQLDMADRLKYEAYHDPVTSLYNRDSFTGRLSYLLEQEEHVRPTAIFIIGLNKFNEFNAQYGHENGDELLRQIAAIISSNICNFPRHMAARIGGTEFSVLLQDLSPDEAASVAEKLLVLLADVSLKDVQPSSVSINIGYSYLTEKSRAKEVMSQADMSLRSSQAKGPGSCVVHDDASTPDTVVRGAMEWRELLIDSIKSDRIDIMFQPVISAQDQDIMHYEILATLPDDSGAVVSASTFFPMAERTGISTEIDKTIIKKSLDYIISENNDERYAINISATSFKDDGFTDWLINLIDSQPAPRDKLIFEVSEYGVISDIDELKSVVEKLRKSNISCSIDNFGVSTGSFGYLKNLKIDYLKLDGSYVANIAENKDHQFFVQTIVQIAHGLEITVIAKSVETSDQAFLLNEMNVDGLQGFHVGKPEKR